jgi:DNA-binding NarL/FixJ family response regulator
LSTFRYRVVVADDSLDLRDLIVLLLDDEDDFTVVGAAADGAEAVQLTAELRPDLLVLDMNMPVMDGIAATREVKSTWPETRVVLLSAIPKSIVPAERVELADAYLEKGLAVTTLVERLRDICHRPAKTG